MSRSPSQELGRWGEDTAAKFLQDQGYEILARNFRIKKYELDIVGWHVKPRFGRTLCFIEVKTRSYGQGSAERATHYEKLTHIFVSARAFCLEKGINLNQTPIQFEQISIYGGVGSNPEIRHYVIPVS